MTGLTSIAKFDGKRWKINVQKNGVRRSFYSAAPGRKGKAEAESKAREWLEGQSETDPTFSAAWEQFLESRKTKVGTSGQTGDVWAGKYYLLPALGKKKLSRITVQDWQDILDKAAKDGKAKATIIDIKTRITNFRKFCLKKRWPTESLELLEVGGAPKKEKRILSQEDIKTIFSDPTSTWYQKAVRDPWWNAYRLAIVLGYRRGEVCGFKWEDLDGEWLEMNRSINKWQEITPGKNANAHRKVKLSKLAVEILNDQKAYLKAEGIISPWIFPDEYGKQMNSNNLYHAWERYLKYHGIDHISFHEIRHTMISMSKKLPRELVKAVVGHSEDMDTFGVYGHMSPEDFDEAAAALDAAMANVLA